MQQGFLCYFFKNSLYLRTIEERVCFCRERISDTSLICVTWRVEINQLKVEVITAGGVC